MYFLKSYLETHKRIKVVAYLTTHNTKGSSGNTVENVEDAGLQLFR